MPTIDVSGHHAYWHNTEAVTFHQRGYTSGVETDTETDIANALRRALTQNDIRTLELDATAVGCVWNLPASELDGTEPRQTDWIEDIDGENWLVRLASLETFGTRWRCVCVREVS